MARYRIICRPSSADPQDTIFEVEEFAELTSIDETIVVAAQWLLIGGPFELLDDAKLFVERTKKLEKHFVVEEFN